MSYTIPGDTIPLPYDAFFYNASYGSLFVRKINNKKRHTGIVYITKTYQNYAERGNEIVKKIKELEDQANKKSGPIQKECKENIWYLRYHFDRLSYEYLGSELSYQIR